MLKSGARLYPLLLGPLLAAASPSPEAAPNIQPPSLSVSIADIARSQREALKPSIESQSCDRGEDNRKSDLCAQWKAADAASDSAWWAWAAGIAGILSSFGVIVALGLSMHSNWIARDTARRQLRAYVSLTEILPWDLKLGHKFGANIICTNRGQTPASSVQISGMMILTNIPADENGLSGRDDYPTGFATMGPGDPVTCTFAFSEPFSIQQLQKIASKELGIFTHGRITYIDVFGDAHYTDFRGILEPPSSFKMLTGGNGST